MFTGIITGTGEIHTLTRQGDGGRLVVAAGVDLSDTRPGDSICVSGACLTVTALEGGRFQADLSAETLDRTTLGGLEPGAAVNLEKALRAGDRLGGHMVTGHVDGIGRVEERQTRDGSERWRVAVPSGLSRFMAEKGSVAVEGVSLTINGVSYTEVVLDLIPHTLEVTNLGPLETGSAVNLEVDLVARYVERLLQGTED